LLVHGARVKDLLQKELGGNYRVEFGMRYRHPSIESAFKKLAEAEVDSIIVIPMYPQYAFSSTGSTITEVKRVSGTLNVGPVSIIDSFFDNPDFIEAWVAVANRYRLNDYDHFLFSYHGLPERQVRKVYPQYCRIDGHCCAEVSDKNIHCYRAACYATTRQLVKRLGIPEGKYTTAFQSRLDDKWLKPYSDRVVEEKAKQGAKRMLVFSPAFVADCLETIYEIGVEYQKIFRDNGGDKLQLVESLNEHPEWIRALGRMVTG
jgi:ferrochelatase